MAQYDVTYNCGHTASINVVGKQADKTRKLNWLESINCSKCNHKNHEDDPIVMSLHTDGLTTDAEGNLLAQIAITGGTRLHKELIKSHGFSWSEIIEGVLSSITSHACKQGWTTFVAFDIIMDDTNEISKSLHELAAKLNTTLTIDINPIEANLAHRQLARKKTTDEAVAKLDKPEVPPAHPSKKGKWNFKYYGKKNNRSYYVNNKKYAVTEAEYTDLMAYRSKLAVYEVEIKKINAEAN